MVIVKISDKRHGKGYRIEFFQADNITEDIIKFVKNNPKAYRVESKNEFYSNREDFFKVYD